MSMTDAAKKLYDKLSLHVLTPPNELLAAPMPECDIEVLCAESSADLENYCCDHAFATLILMAYGKEEFYRVVDKIMKKIKRTDIETFDFIMDCDGQTKIGHHPLDLNLFDLAEAMAIINKYYFGATDLLYRAVARHVLGRDKARGRKRIIDAIAESYSISSSDLKALDEIYKSLIL